MAMSDRRFVYIDGESHYIRSEHTWRQLHGEEACLERLRYVNQADDRIVLVLPEAKVFWTRRMNPNVLRATYFTSASGDEPALHKLKVALRDFGLEPSIVKETKELRSQRQNLLKMQQLIEKTKGVDSSLAVRMLEDSHRQAFDACHLYTSDVDFLPVIQAIRAQGKQVFVHGYRNGLSQLSPLLHEPDLFIDLEEMLCNECELAPTK
jgi:uncharacterized LabA/DUF88 family protein